MLSLEEKRRRKRQCWKRWYYANREKRLASKKRGSRAVKSEVLTYYGNGKLACVKCGFNDMRALTLDHIKGGGEQKRKKGEGCGVTLYYFLRKRNYPEGYQTLCANCQFIKRVENHEYIQIENQASMLFSDE